ncbi:sensor histidine kinase [Fimbriimonas ginsengisoli Gsoil 348]|uniref:histidine kinase n=2 Tax=Fimbriimonas ginsengisoli TaxID=1005039 RepID=A0A068NL78_FIMGI|nr:sensor histidine kinase [Fimbriimonas ginsengisoli Gsoil 348]
MKEKRAWSKPEPESRLSVNSFRGILLTVCAVLLMEPFFPNRSIGDPGLFLWIANLLTVYLFGTIPGLISAALLCAYIAIGPLIPGSAFEHTPKNELRIVGSAIIFGTSSLLVGLVRAKIQKEARRASNASREAEMEADLRHRAELHLRDSETLRRLVVESSMDAIAACDKDGHIILWNRHAEEMFGWSAAEAMGRPIQEQVDVAWTDGPSLPFAHRLESRGCARGERGFDVELYVVPHESPEGRIFMFFIRDISERKAAEAAIQTLNASLEERVAERTAELTAKNEELEGFSFAISHDMRSPLRSIVANARFVLEDERDRVSADGRLSLERLAGSAMQMSLMVDDLLRYARLGNQAVRIEPIALSEIAASARSEVLVSYPQATIEIEPSLEAMGDSMLMSMVLVNLFDNACKYSRAGEPARVTFGKIEQGGEPVFFVRDNGIGFNMAHADKLFRPFERLHSESEYPGTGFGLANVRRSIARQRGRVWVDSTPGQGTTFSSP